MSHRVGLVLLLGWLSTPSLAQEMEVESGLWEFVIRYEIIGVPQHFPKYVKQQCITTEKPIPAISRPGQECVDTLQGRFGKRTLTWELDCSTDWEMVHGMGRIHYDGSKAEGDVHLQVLNPYNPPQPMVFQLEGKRIGKCDK